MEAGYQTFMVGHERFGRDMACFMRGEMTGDQLLDKVNDHRGQLAAAHLMIGIDQLAENRRIEAKQSFEQAVATNFHQYYVFNFAWVFRELVQDEQWLPWLSTNSSKSRTIE